MTHNAPTQPVENLQWLVCFRGAGVMIVVYEIRKRLWVPAVAQARGS